ncbi:NAD-dependent epimerase/dehydratase family protein [Anaeromyxobacter oryzisoli]|uniref:NAD-dependent epimerase/dehydratase family protein n=1 Tax=Anaeromyxobacter oryzisoli TaxID=2925408 RepID=UPI001F577904|nr:NAD-dependent epimerase/dehydratase family protein [Anaeromyxobacter sp. SG63]
MRVLVAGCGWLGTAIAGRLVARGDEVTGIRRDPARAEALRAHGVEPLAVDLAAPGALARLPSFDAAIACQSATADTPEAYRAAYVEANRTLLAAAARTGARLVYTGSTGVFGQRDGSDVDEATAPAPASGTGAVLVEAEALVRAAGGTVLRLSGLYGPGRAGIIDRVRSGRLALGPGDGAWMNFCHRDDAAAFVLAALERGAAGAVYHGSDASPARRREVVEWIAARLRIPPPHGEAPSGPDRRIRSEVTRAALAVSLAYPSFREGLAPLFAPTPG